MEYSDFEQKDVDVLTELYREYLNDGDILADLIRDACEKGILFGAKAVENDKTVGIFTFQEGLSFTCPRPDLDSKIRSLTGNGRIATGDTLVVLPEYRGKGIAGNLTKRDKELFRERNIDYVMVECWVFPDGRSPSLKLHKTIGPLIYEELIPDFYRDISKYGITCPICGENCRCMADILLFDVRYLRDTDGKDYSS